MRHRGGACLALASFAAACGPPSGPLPWFEEIAVPSGVVFEHRSGRASRPLFPEINGGGAALFDMDGDGDLDAYLVQSGSVRDPQAGPGNQLFRNEGGGRFLDVTAASGAESRGYGMGVAAGDYDDDGDTDLYVTNWGPNVLLRNEGGGRFTDVSRAAGVDDPGWGTSAAFLDYDADGDLDLYVANYVRWSLETELDCYSTSGLADYCNPLNYDAPSMDRLFRNEGTGQFTDVSLEVGLGSVFGNGLGVVPTDFDGDGRLDVFVANDLSPHQLWMGRSGAFQDEALARGCAVDESGAPKSGMGVAVEDLDGDGDDDLLVVNLEGQTDTFFRNDSGSCRDTTAEVGLAGVGRRFTRFGVGLQDFDNDGRLDLYEANGRVTLAAEPEGDDPYAEPNLLFRGTPTGRFEEVLPRGGTAQPLVATSRGAAFGDVDGDGGVDVLVSNRDARAHLLRNVVPRRGHWIRFVARERSGRDALGARLTIELAGGVRVTRTIRPAYSYCSSSDPGAHVGLGSSGRVAAVEVRWADGVRERFGAFDADRTVELRRGAGTAAP